MIKADVIIQSNYSKLLKVLVELTVTVINYSRHTPCILTIQSLLVSVLFSIVILVVLVEK